MEDPVLNVLHPPRDCGPCTACCTHLPIPAGIVATEEKPAGTPCPHQVCRGCGHYASRPTACREFACAWLADPNWPLSWRPRECGLLCLRETLDDGRIGAVVYELLQGAGGAATGQTILAHLREACHLVVLIRRDGRRLRFDRAASEPPAPHSSRRRRSGPRRAA